MLRVERLRDVRSVDRDGCEGNTMSFMFMVLGFVMVVDGRGV